MALNVFELFGKIAIDSSGAKSGLDSAVGHAQKAESKLAATFKKIGTAVAAAFSVKAIVDFGKQCTQAHATIAAEQSAFAQIMGDYAGTAQQKLDAVASKTGVVSTRLTSSMTSLTAKFKGLGYNVADATTLAADGLMIASDAAAFWDMSLEESMSHLNSFINGSYEGGEAIGLFANDTQMAAYAVEQGIVADTKAWAKLDEAQRQATRLQYAMNMQKMSGAVGQAAKESQQYANVMANLKEHWRQFQGIIGKPILEKLVLPAMQKLNEFMPKLNKAVQEGIVWLDNGFNKIKSYFTDVFTEDGINFSALPAALGRMFGDLVSLIPGWLADVGRTINNIWTNTVWPTVQGVFKATLGIELPSWSEITTAVSTWWTNGGLAQAIADVCNWTLNLFGAPATVTKEGVSSVLSAWWSNTVTFVQDACEWVLKLFKNPKETVAEVGAAIGTWWTGVKESVQNACEWALNLFKNPPDVTAAEVEAILDTWWSKAVTFVQDACSWVLNLFGVPEDITAQDVADILGSWWSKAVTFVQDACTWTLNLFTNPTADQQEILSVISGWWDVACAIVEGACNWVLHLFGAPKEVTVSEISNVLSTWWSNTKTFVQNACKWVLKIFDPPTENPVTVITDWWNGVKASIANICKAPVKAEGEPVSSARSRIQSWWNSVKSGLNLAVQATVNVVQSIVGFGGGSGSFGGRGSASGTGFTSGAMVATPDSNSSFDKFFNSHATGLDYVPYDNYLARLHKGEAVLTSSEADVWRGGGSTGRVEAALTQMSDILRVIAQNTGADKQVVLDTGAVVGQLAPGIDAQLGMYMNRKGRRN